MKWLLLANTLAWIALSACQKATPTFNSDIAAIVFKNCTTCHRTGNQAVPFTLLGYDDAKTISLFDPMTGRSRISGGAIRIRNSWGPSWGDSGFAYASADYLVSAFSEFFGLYR